VAVLRYAAALIVALLLVGALLLAVGADPLLAYATIIRASLGSLGSIGQTLNKATPLILGALGVAFAMRGGFLNVGVDGQIYVGAICATGMAFLLGGQAPAGLVLPVVLLAGVSGGLLAVLPASTHRQQLPGRTSHKGPSHCADDRSTNSGRPAS